MDDSAESRCKHKRVGESFSSEEIPDLVQPALHVSDPRVAQLLVALDEMDSWVGDQKLLSEQQVEELIGMAIHDCGFEDSREVQSTIAAILDAIWPANHGHS